ncbi:c-type cytochrome [Deltaproteobacteria bacterium TL4]
MKNLLISGITLMLSIGATIQVNAAGRVSEGKELYVLCGSCHGANGEGSETLKTPNLAGQRDVYLRRQLMDYKNDVRGNDSKDDFGFQMRAMTFTLTDEQKVDDVIAYIGTLRGLIPKTVKGNPSKGKKLFMLCASCHGADGKGDPVLTTPRLAGLYDWYIVRQLKNFRTGMRGTNPKNPYALQMPPMAKALANDQEIYDVAAYAATLK